MRLAHKDSSTRARTYSPLSSVADGRLGGGTVGLMAFGLLFVLITFDGTEPVPRNETGTVAATLLFAS